MYKKQIGQQILFLLSVFLCSYFFVRVDSLQCLKNNYARAWLCNCSPLQCYNYFVLKRRKHRACGDPVLSYVL